MKTQIWIAVTVYVLVAIVKKRLGLKQDLYTLLQILSLTLFEKIPILSLFQQSHYNLEMVHDINQLQLLETLLRFDDRFDSGFNEFGKAFYFSTSSFNTSLFGSGKLRDLIVAHLSLKQPLDLNGLISKTTAVQVLKEYNNFFAVHITPDFHGPLQVGQLLQFIQERDKASYERLRPFMEHLGCDGFKHYADSYTSFITEPSSVGFVTYAAFRPDQIRFAE